MMRKRLLVVIGVLVASAGASKTAQASFVREYERYNRQQSERVIEDIDKELQIRIDESKGIKKEGEEESAETGPGEVPMRRPGGWKVKPKFSVLFTRDSNIFQSRNDPETEAIFTYIPSVQASSTLFDFWKYSTTYEMRYMDYLHFEHNSRAEHTLTNSVTRKWNRMNLSVADEFGLFALPTEDDRFKSSALKSNSLSARLTYSLGPKTSVSSYYTNQYISFRNASERASSSQNDTVGIRLTHRVAQDMDGYVDYSYRWSRPPKLPKTHDINAQQVLFGVEGAVTQKIALSASVGIVGREFALGDDKVKLVAQGVVNYRLSPSTMITGTYQRDTVPTGAETAADPKDQVFGVRLNHRMNNRLYLYGGENYRYSESGVIKTVQDVDNPAITTTKEDESYILETNLGFRYRLLKNLLLNVDYTFEKIRSELKIDDRISNVTKVETTYEF